jgi:aryl-alcohol dehydrogenase-like predicted oxidoreductase
VVRHRSTHRPAGRDGAQGIKVSPYALGAMMFGAGGNPGHEDAIRIIHKALDAGDQPRRHR